MFAEYRKRVVAAVLFVAACAAQAQDARTQARTGAVADGVSSVVGAAAGAPVNPLLPIAGLAFKAVTLRRAESLPDTERPRAYAMAAAGWQGSAAGNVCAAASALSGGSFLPACVVIGVAWGWRTWKASERERRDAERCAMLRRSARKPKLRCAFMRPHVQRVAAPMRNLRRAAAPAPKFLAAQDLVAP